MATRTPTSLLLTDAQRFQLDVEVERRLEPVAVPTSDAVVIMIAAARVPVGTIASGVAGGMQLAIISGMALRITSTGCLRLRTAASVRLREGAKGLFALTLSVCLQPAHARLLDERQDTLGVVPPELCREAGGGPPLSIGAERLLRHGGVLAPPIVLPAPNRRTTVRRWSVDGSTIRAVDWWRALT